MNFDLDINNYTKSDLEDLLDLKYPYFASDVSTKCTVFQESITNNSSLDLTLSKRVTDFLEQVKATLNDTSNNHTDLLSHKNFENPRLPNSKVLQVGNSQIIEQSMRNSTNADQPTTTALTSNLAYTLGGDEAPGKMNPLYKRSVTKCLTIDSRFRDNYYSTQSSNFMINLPIKFSDVIQLQLSEIELPLTFYAISKELGNNYFWLRIVANTLITDFFNMKKWKFGQYNGSWQEVSDKKKLENGDIGYTFIEIPNGNYTHSDLTKYLNQQLSSLFTFVSGSDTDYGEFIKVVIDINQSGSGSGRTIISSTSFTIPLDKNQVEHLDGNLIKDGNERGIPAVATRFELNFAAPYPAYKMDDLYYTLDYVQETYNKTDIQPLPLKFGWMLGFRHPIYSSFNKLTDPYTEEIKSSKPSDIMNLKGSTYLSEGFFECHGPRYLFLVVDDFNNNVTNNMFSAFNSSILSKNILARISVKGTVFSILSDDAKQITSNNREYFGPVNIEKLRIQLLDEYGRVIDMNNMDFSMALNLKCIYDS